MTNESNPVWWSEGQVPTPKEYVDWFLSLPRERQESLATYIITNAQEATNCFQMNHEGQLEYLKAELDRINANKAPCGCNPDQVIICAIAVAHGERIPDKCVGRG